MAVLALPKAGILISFKELFSSQTEPYDRKLLYTNPKLLLTAKHMFSKAVSYSEECVVNNEVIDFVSDFTFEVVSRTSRCAAIFVLS